ncbi:PREDICTED: uncharacterized protein LOC109239035 [Nicotiana attenuata]|uniref:uncharacterized protein LOC109239035 n=1 Tax=Nicotiana attenuata TaxID=49451 RepID=UPI0009059E10|nr:PREDICTED: uncharacterized protein LOC109239035 [Nicotiana attenuata]
MSKEATNNIPVWVNFPGLPIQYWTVENLGRIASSIGIPICTDKLTVQEARISYARMLIKMVVSQPLPEIVLIETADGKHREQTLSYDWQPSFCQDCLQIGHHTGECSAQAEMIQKTSPAPKGQAGTKKQQGEQHKKGTKQVTKWVVKPNAAKETQGQEARDEPSTNKATTTIVTRQEEGSEGTVQNKNAEFQLAKTKGKQVQSPKVRTSLRDGLSDANIEAMLHQNRFSALRIHEKEDASQESKEGRVPLAQSP